MTDEPGPIVTLLRHGETEWSRSGQHTGSTDLDLTEAGEEQARAAGRRLAGPFDLVLTSPLLRARRTAELAGLADPEVLDDLREWDYGAYEGLTTPQIQERVPGWSIWSGPWDGGETAEDVGERADRVVTRILKAGPGAPVAVVGHGHFLRVVAARWLRQPVALGRSLPLGTAAICTLGWEHDDPALRLWNLTDAFS